MQRVTVATFNSPSPAQAVMKRLIDARINASLIDERNLQRYWFFAQPFGGIHVKVEKKDFQQATELVERLDTEEGMLREAIRCPNCSSSRIEYPQMTRYFILPTLLAQFLHLIHVLPLQFYCRTCQNTWRPRRAEMPRKKFKKRPKPLPGS